MGVGKMRETPSNFIGAQPGLGCFSIGLLGCIARDLGFLVAHSRQTAELSGDHEIPSRSFGNCKDNDMDGLVALGHTWNGP